MTMPASAPSASQSDRDNSGAMHSHHAGQARQEFDIAVIGGGVVGCAVARLLSHHQAKVALLDANPDVGAATSKANTAILHTGFDATPGSIESRLVARGYTLLDRYAAETGIAVERTGAVLVAWNDDQADALAGVLAKASQNGYQDARCIDEKELREREPHLGPGALAGLVVPGEHIIDPWSTPIAFATEAAANDCSLVMNFALAAVEVTADHTRLVAKDGRQVITKFVVNASGLGGDHVHELFGFEGFRITPRRGELIVYDKLARPLVQRALLPVPTAHTKGVLVAPTVFGNVMVGPTADDIEDRTATGSTRSGLDRLTEAAKKILPALANEEVTAVYAGLRAATEHSDYQLSSDAGARYVGLNGIRSTGLTASMALAEEALERLGSIGADLRTKDPDSLVTVRLTPLGEAGPRPYQRGGKIVCHCERVTEAEIRSAVTATVPAATLDGVRRRTRALAGRCQGFYCSAEVCAIATKETGRPLSTWLGLS
jgi:glycerol-3-phosphate dehydrogenase